MGSSRWFRFNPKEKTPNRPPWVNQIPSTPPTPHLRVERSLERLVVRSEHHGSWGSPETGVLAAALAFFCCIWYLYACTCTYMYTCVCACARSQVVLFSARGQKGRANLAGSALSPAGAVRRKGTLFLVMSFSGLTCSKEENKRRPCSLLVDLEEPFPSSLECVSYNV